MINLKYKYEDVIKYWQEQKLESKEDYMNILENFSVLFAYNSGAIENDKITKAKITGCNGTIRRNRRYLSENRPKTPVSLPSIIQNLHFV